MLVLPAAAAYASTGDVSSAGLPLHAAPPVAVSVNLVPVEKPVSDDVANGRIASIASVPTALVTSQFGVAAGRAALENERGGSEAAVTSPGSIISGGTVSSNRAVEVVTGSNAIREGSFANASGIPVVIQNTGANVLIQNSTVVNIQLR